MKFKLIIDKDRDEEVVVTVHERSELTDRIESLVLEYSGSQTITAYTEDDLVRLDFDHIECITVIDGKTYAIDTDGKQHLVKMRLYEIEQLLPNYFVRINKSAIANQSQIAKFKASFSGAVDVIFKCGHVDYVSRRCFSEIKRRYQL